VLLIGRHDGRVEIASADSPVGQSTGQLIVELEPGASISAIDDTLSQISWSVVDSREGYGSLGPVVLIERTSSEGSGHASARAALALASGVHRVEENIQATIDGTYGAQQSQVPIFADELELTSMRDQSALTDAGLGAPSGTSGHASVRVAVIDGGFDLSVEALEGRCEDAFDAISNDQDPNDAGNGNDDDADGHVDNGVGHGTAVAALIAVAAPEATIIPIRALDDEGVGTIWSIRSAIVGALSLGAKVINLSFGAPCSCPLIEDALTAAANEDVLVVASAGNTGDDNVSYPATSTLTIGITGVDVNGARDTDASVGTAVDASARSIDVIAPYPGTADGYGYWYGTSVAAALFTGAAARVLQQDEGSPIDAGAALLGATDAYASSSDPYATKMGSGILNASSLLDD
jgi:hypothetical protein